MLSRGVPFGLACVGILFIATIVFWMRSAGGGQPAFRWRWNGRKIEQARMCAVQPGTMRFTFLFAVVALAAGCASTPSSPPSVTSSTVDTNDPSFTPPSEDGFVMVETARIGEAPPPRTAASPVALPAPNREAPGCWPRSQATARGARSPLARSSAVVSGS